MILKYKFFDLCSKNEYKVTIDKNEDAEPEIIELIEKVEHEIAEEDMNDNFDEKTLSFYENICINWDIYLGLIMNFATTLFCFPFLSFKLGDFITPNLRSGIITLMFNFGDILSLLFAGYQFITYDSPLIPHILNIFKFFTIFINLYLIEKETRFKIILVFFQRFLNGYLVLTYIQLANRKFKSIFDKNRVGYLNSFSILTGLSIGAFSSFFLN